MLLIETQVICFAPFNKFYSFNNLIPFPDTLSPEYYINIRTGTRYFQSVDIDLQSKHDNLRSFTGHASQREEFATKVIIWKYTSYVQI